MKIFSAAIAAITIINKPSNAQRDVSQLRNFQEGTSTSDASGLGFDSQQWGGFDVMANEFDEGYMGNYETIDTRMISQEFSGVGSAWVFDLGSTGSLMRRRGAVITLSEIRAIWHELSPIVAENHGVVMKSVGDSLFLFFDNVSDGLTATRAMYLAVIDRYRMKSELACIGDVSSPEEWCGDETEQRKRFYNTGAIGGAYGEMLLISEDGLIDAYGSAVNNAFFAGEEEAEHGEFLIDEGALQHLLTEAEGVPQDDACQHQVVNWTAGDLGVDHIDVKNYGFFCYYRVCFDSECQIPDDE